MSIIVQIVYSAPHMNTRSMKKLLPNNPLNPNFRQGGINSQQYFFTLPNMLDDNLYVHLVQCNAMLFDLQDLGHEELIEHKRRKRDAMKARKLSRVKKAAEKLV